MKTKRRSELLAFYDHSGIERHLEAMARKGWMLEDISNFGWVYRKSEPRPAHYTVSYYPKASEFDPRPSEGQETFFDFCAHTGWTKVCTWHQMQVFRNDREDPVPIETDPVSEVDTLHEACKKNFLPTQFLMLFLGLFYLGTVILSLAGNVPATLADPAKLFLSLCGVLMIIMTVFELTVYFRWYKKAAEMAEQGIFLETPCTRPAQKFFLLVLIGAVVSMLVSLGLSSNNTLLLGLGVGAIYMVVLYGAVWGTQRLLKRFGVERNTNRVVTLLVDAVLAFGLMGTMTAGTVKLSRMGFFNHNQETYEHHGQTIVAYHDEIPLTLEELMGVDYEGYVTRRTGSETFLVGQYTYYQRPRYDAEDYSVMPDISYTVTTVKLPALYDACFKKAYQSMETTADNVYRNLDVGLVQIDPAPWGASDAYQLYDHETDCAYCSYLLCYESNIVTLQLSRDITPEQMAIVGARLGN